MKHNTGPQRGPYGQHLTDGLPKGPRVADVSIRPLRGFVTAVYISDVGVSGNASSLTQAQGARGVYCDVYLYGARNGPLPRVLVPLSAGLHEGDVRLPRPAEHKVGGSGNVVDFQRGLITPEQVDADHVLIDFIEGSVNHPYVHSTITHPQLDYGNEDAALGVRLLPRASEGQPRVLRHRGVSVVITDQGNVQVDTSRAHGAGRQIDGSELPASASAGNVDVTIASAARLHVRSGDRELLTLQGGAEEAVLTLGTGTRHPAQAEELRALMASWEARFNALVGAFNASMVAIANHQHPIALGVAVPAPPLATLPTTVQPAPSWDTAIENDRVAFPPRLA